MSTNKQVRWEVGEFDDFDETYEVIEAGSLRRGIGYVIQTTICRECDEESAHLIAAAPELLEALERARQFIRNGVELGYIRMPDVDTPDSAHDTLPMIEAAIAKARGTP